MTKRLVVELDKANELIDDINQIAEKYNVAPRYEGYEISVDFKDLLKPQYVDTAEEEAPVYDAIPSYNEIDVVMFIDAVNSLEKGKTVKEKIKAAAEITDLALETVSAIYHYKGRYKKVYKNTNEAVKKLYEHCRLVEESKAAEEVKAISKKVPPKSGRAVKSKNDSMIERVIRALGTDDPDAVAKKITSSANILNQTDFKDYDDVMEYLKCRGNDS